MDRPEEAPLIDRDLWHKHTHTGVRCEDSMCVCVAYFSEHRSRQELGVALKSTKASDAITHISREVASKPSANTSKAL